MPHAQLAAFPFRTGEPSWHIDMAKHEQNHAGSLATLLSPDAGTLSDCRDIRDDD
jgi:hypothetical protein